MQNHYLPLSASKSTRAAVVIYDSPVALQPVKIKSIPDMVRAVPEQ
jgi:hypothetical protein